MLEFVCKQCGFIQQPKTKEEHWNTFDTNVQNAGVN